MQPTLPDSPTSARDSNRLNVSQGERMGSLLGGSLLALWGLRRFSLTGLLAAASGGVLIYRGATDHSIAYEQLEMSTATEKDQALGAVEAEVSATVNRPREEVYAFWRKLENLPRFMHHLATVKETGEQTSHWEAVVPGGMGTLTWEAKITTEEPGEVLAWQSNPDAVVRNAGRVDFRDAPGGRGTEVHVTIDYRPPAGQMGAAAARFLSPALHQMVKDDVRRFKNLMETGEVPQIEGQPTGQGRK